MAVFWSLKTKKITPFSLVSLERSGKSNCTPLTPGLFEFDDGFWKLDDLEGLTLDPARKAYVHLARGRLTVSGHALNAGDALAIDGETALSLHDGQDAEVLVFELQP